MKRQELEFLSKLLRAASAIACRHPEARGAVSWGSLPAAERKEIVEAIEEGWESARHKANVEFALQFYADSPPPLWLLLAYFADKVRPFIRLNPLRKDVAAEMSWQHHTKGQMTATELYMRVVGERALTVELQVDGLWIAGTRWAEDGLATGEGSETFLDAESGADWLLDQEIGRCYAQLRLLGEKV